MIQSLDLFLARDTAGKSPPAHSQANSFGEPGVLFLCYIFKGCSGCSERGSSSFPWFVGEWKAKAWWGRILSQWARAHGNSNFPISIAAPEGRNPVFTFSFRNLPLNPVFSFAAVASKLLLFSRSLFFTGGSFPKERWNCIYLGHWGDPNPLYPMCISGVKLIVNFFHHHFHGPRLSFQAESPLSSPLNPAESRF